MRFLALPLLLLVACGSSPREGRPTLPGQRRKAITAPPSSGWVRLPLDREAQEAFPRLWLGDARGASVPYLVERDGLWQPRELKLERLALGLDSGKNPTAEFALKFPQGWQVRDREQLHIQLELEGAAPWVCRVEVARRQEGGQAIAFQGEGPLHIFDLGEAGRQDAFSVPWDSRIYRVTLEPIQGAAPRIKGLRVTAATVPSARLEDEAIAPRLEPIDGHRWRLSLGAPERIQGAEITLEPPVAPIAPIFTRPTEPGRREEAEACVPSRGMLWNLPALQTASNRVSLGPLTTDRLHMGLPEGVRLKSVRLLVRRDVLIFPAEAGQAYFLHLGGQPKRAPGNLEALPDSSRAVYQRAALGLSTSETDPEGIPEKAEWSDRTRPWLPWFTGLVVLALGWTAWRLLREAHRS